MNPINKADVIDDMDSDINTISINKKFLYTPYISKKIKVPKDIT